MDDHMITHGDLRLNNRTAHARDRQVPVLHVILLVTMSSVGL